MAAPISDAELKQLAILNGATHLGTPYIATWLGAPDGTLDVAPPSQDGPEGVDLLIEDGETPVLATHAFVFIQVRRDASKFQGTISFGGVPVAGEAPGIDINGNSYTHVLGPGEDYDDLAAALEPLIEAGEDIDVEIESGPVLRCVATAGGGTPAWENTFSMSAIDSLSTLVQSAPDARSVDWELWGLAPARTKAGSMLLPDTPLVDIPPNVVAWQRPVGNDELTEGTAEQNAVFRIRCAGMRKLFIRPKNGDGVVIMGVIPCTLVDSV